MVTCRTSHGPQESSRCTSWLHVEYAERRRKYGILFIFRPVYEYSNLEYEHVPVEYRLHQAENGIHIRVAASQVYVNTYSTRRECTVHQLSIVVCESFALQINLYLPG